MSEKRWLKVLSSPLHGKGLFSTRDIKKGTLVGVCQTRRTGEAGLHTLTLNNGNQVDVTCKLKYINHSKSPNVAYFDDLTVESLKDIKAGEELLHDYGDEW